MAEYWYCSCRFSGRANADYPKEGGDHEPYAYLRSAFPSLLAASELTIAAILQVSCSGSEVGSGTALCDPACADDQDCIDAICVSKATCAGDNDCPSDPYCLNGRCAAYGGDHVNNPTCERLAPAGLLSPQIF